MVMFSPVYRSVGILPQDHSAVRHRDQLRRERQAEYQAFLSQHHTANKTNTRGEGATIDTRSSQNTPPPPPPLSRPPSSLVERRRTLATERRHELNYDFSRDRPLPPPAHDHPPSYYGGKYTSSERRRYGDHSEDWSRREGLGRSNEQGSYHREPQDVPLRRHTDRRWQRMEEERPYHRQYGSEDLSEGSLQRRRWGEGHGEGATAPPQVHFERDDNVERINPERAPKRWDEEEEGLLQWARGQGKTVESNVNGCRPPALPSKSLLHRRGDSRSLSAPVASVGIAALGAGDSESEKRRKQREYAEQLRAQMREKQMAKERERELVLDTQPANHHGAKDFSTSPPPVSRWNRSTEEEHKSTRPMRDFPQRDERVRFVPDRDSTQNHTTRDPPPGPHNASESSSKTGNPPFPPYWPSMYYGGFSYPPPPNFPLPPPQNGVPYYPPPPSLSNPYLPSHYPQPLAGEYDPEPRRWTRHEQSGLNDSLSPQRVKGREREGLNLLRGSSGGNRGEKVDKEAYRVQLIEQMREKRESKQREHFKRIEFDKKTEREIYDPFGKGGCGAPLRDRRGQLVTDLKHMKKVNDERMIIGLPSTTPLPGEVAEGGAAGVLDSSLTEPTSPQSSYDVRRSKELRSKRSMQEDYKEMLKQQMKEREELKRQEKEKNSQEERLEAERIEKELKMLEENYKLEKEREKEKQHELKMKNEAMRHEKEEKEREELERKSEEEWRQQEALRLEAEQKKQALIDNMERQLPQYPQVRSNSPPIPTLRKLNHQMSGSPTAPHLNEQQQRQRPPSPPVPALRHKMLLNSENRSLPQDGHGSTSDQYTSTDNQHVPFSHDNHVRTSSPVVPALRNKQATFNSEQPYHQVTRSISAGAAVPQTEHLPRNKGGVKPDVVGPSLSDHHLLQPRISEAPVPPSTSDPNPSSSTLRSPQPQESAAHMEDDKMESMLKNLRSMRRMLETERQKIAVQKQPDPTTTAGPIDSAALPDEALNMKQNGVRPVFWKARLAAPRKSGSSPSVSKATLTDTLHKQQQHLGQRKQRRQWQDTPSESKNHQQPSETSPKKSTSVNQDRTEHSSVFATGKRTTPPLWLTRAPRSNRSPSVAPSVGGQSQFSIATLDVDSMARRNEERMKRLEGILNTQARDSRSPQAILSDFLTRTREPTSTGSTHHTLSHLPISTGQDSQSMSSYGGYELDCETDLQPVSTTPT